MRKSGGERNDRLAPDLLVLTSTTGNCWQKKPGQTPGVLLNLEENDRDLRLVWNILCPDWLCKSCQSGECPCAAKC
jgi:hypothetical protein